MARMFSLFLLLASCWCALGNNIPQCDPTVFGDVPFPNFVVDQKCDIDANLMNLFREEDSFSFLVNKTAGNVMCIGFIEVFNMAREDSCTYDSLATIPNEDFCNNSKVFDMLTQANNSDAFDGHNKVIKVVGYVLNHCDYMCSDLTGSSVLCWAFGEYVKLFMKHHVHISPTNEVPTVTTKPSFLSSFEAKEKDGDSVGEGEKITVGGISEESPSSSKQEEGMYQPTKSTDQTMDSINQTTKGTDQLNDQTTDSTDPPSKSTDQATESTVVSITESTESNNQTTEITPDSIAQPSESTNQTADNTDQTAKSTVQLTETTEQPAQIIDQPSENINSTIEHPEDHNTMLHYGDDLFGELDNGNGNGNGSDKQTTNSQNEKSDKGDSGNSNGADEYEYDDNDDDDGYSYWHFTAVLLFILFLGVGIYLASMNRKKVCLTVCCVAEVVTSLWDYYNSP